MSEFEELRYPFLSLGDFITGGYWLEPAAAHLTAGLLFQLGFILVVFRGRGTFVEKSVTCYFSLAIFNNFAYSVGGLRIGEMFGALAAFAVLLDLRRGCLSRRSLVGSALAIAGGIVLLHALIIGAVDPALDGSWGARALRMVLIAKIFVLALVATAVERDVFSADGVSRLVKGMVVGGAVACVLYLVQLGLFAGGMRPYGTFWDAGFTGVPSFGSVSIERGHFGKFLVPLFPLFLLLAIERKRRWPFALFLFVSAINFSASNIAFLLGYLALSALMFWRSLLHGWRLLVVPAAAIAFTALLARFSDQYEGIFNKIVQFAFEGEYGGGRGTDVLTAYLGTYPFGTSYSGSTLRTVGSLPEINMGIYAFVAQFSLLALPLLLAYAFLNLRVLHRSAPVVEDHEWRALSVGVLMSFLIFTADILWFVPTIWAPVLLLSRLSMSPPGAPASVAVPYRVAAAPR